MLFLWPRSEDEDARLKALKPFLLCADSLRFQVYGLNPGQHHTGQGSVPSYYLRAVMARAGHMTWVKLRPAVLIL